MLTDKGNIELIERSQDTGLGAALYIYQNSPPTSWLQTFYKTCLSLIWTQHTCCPTYYRVSCSPLSSYADADAVCNVSKAVHGTAGHLRLI